jgi:hypothetical protein
MACSKRHERDKAIPSTRGVHDAQCVKNASTTLKFWKNWSLLITECTIRRAKTLVSAGATYETY